MSRLDKISDPDSIGTIDEWLENTKRHSAQLNYEAQRIRCERIGVPMCKPLIKKIDAVSMYFGAYEHFSWMVVLWKRPESDQGLGLVFKSHAGAVKFLQRVPQVYTDRRHLDAPGQ